MTILSAPLLQRKRKKGQGGVSEVQAWENDSDVLRHGLERQITSGRIAAGAEAWRKRRVSGVPFSFGQLWKVLRRRLDKSQ